LQAVTSTSNSLQDDIKSLAEQLNNVCLDSVQQTVAQFTASHRDLLEHLSNRLDSIFALHTDFRALSDESQIATARQSILDSLQFPQIRERRDHVLKAHNETYQWILEPEQGGTQRWDDFISWLRASSSESRIYWVHGKIGAGKTTLLRFLDDNLSLFKHMLPWANEAGVVRASCFFWNAGNKLQKSTTGLLRTLLTQLFEQTPDLIPRVVQPRKWQTARLAGNHVIDWTDSELQDCLREYILYAAKSTKVFLLVDGLDEFEGTDEAREDLIDLLVASAAYENVKICLSSRPWNIFRDAFGSCPQLKLEDLTYNDISAYVREQLYGNKRFHKLMQYDTIAAEGLVASLISKAAGVFLWVRLVVKQLLKGLRDGDGIRALSKKVEEIPADLDDYFMRLMESIEPQNRKEASELFQLALYDKDEFSSLHSNCLLDFSFIEEGKPDFALHPFYIFSGLDFADTGAMAFRLESTMRKLNSRCMGLLECHDEVDQGFQLRKLQEDSDDEASTTTGFEYLGSNKTNVPLDAAELLDKSDVFTMAHLTIDFLHRSLRDFLLTPKVQTLLHQYTQGPYDARMFFRNARLVQLVAPNKVEADLYATIGLASYVLSTLTVSGYQDTPSASTVATIMRPVIENLVRFERTEKALGWYICCVLQSWHDEDSTFLTLAIDFGLDSYVRANLTPQSVQSKKGRPILDYILRPRFVKGRLVICVGNQLPDSALLNAVLGFGADPNQRYQGVSIWALFLCFIADHFRGEIPNGTFIGEAAYFEALKIMIQNGADVLLPRNWLSDAAYINIYGGDDWLDEVSDKRLRRRFPNTTPAIQGSTRSDTFYAVGDLLECFRDCFRLSLDTLKTLVLQREAQSPRLLRPPARLRALTRTE
jgi:hypothetical protein